VLLVRLGALGDIVHAIPVAAALRRAFPSSRIDWLVSAKHREILELVSVLDHRIVVNDRGDASGGMSMRQAIRQLRQTGYDAAIDLQGLIKSATIARLSGAARVVGFSRKYARESLAAMLYTDAYDPGGDGIYAWTEKRHVVDINLGLLTPLGVERANAREFPIEARASAAAEEMKAASGGHYAILNPGAAWPNKRWPPDRLAAVARALNDRHGLRSVIVWGPDERPLAEAVVAAAPGAALLSPPTTIADMVALARGATVMVSGDTGPTHIASAVGTPVVGIYGPTRPERNGPWLAEDETVSRADVCECHHLRQCRRPRMCLLDIDTEEVLAAVERRLAAMVRHRA
jgi:lipopolysaccharide heptosyltransferase I